MADEALKPHPGEKSLEPFDMAIGKMCRKWALLEKSVANLFLKVAGWDYRLPGTYAMLSCIDIRDQISAIRVGILANDCRSDIIDLVFGSINYIDGRLREARNRLVHDLRTTADDGVRARHFKDHYSYGKRPGSGELILKEPTVTHITIGEVYELTNDIEEETTFLLKLCEWFRNPHDRPLGPLFAPPPRQHLQSLIEEQRQMDRALSKQKRQTQPRGIKPSRPLP